MNDQNANLLGRVGAQSSEGVEFARRKDSLSAEESLDFENLKIQTPNPALSAQNSEGSISQDSETIKKEE